MKDGPKKSILVKDQWKWFEEDMKAFDATFNHHDVDGKETYSTEI